MKLTGKIIFLSILFAFTNALQAQQFISINPKPDVLSLWKIGETKQISGIVAYSDSFIVSYSIDNGASFIDFDTVQLTSNNFVVDIIVPSSISGTYQGIIRVRNIAGDAFDQFNIQLSNSASQFRITSPLKGDQVSKMQNGSLRCTNYGAATTADIYLTTDGGLNWFNYQPYSYFQANSIDLPIGTIDSYISETSNAIWAIVKDGVFLAISDTFVIVPPQKGSFFYQPQLYEWTNINNTSSPNLIRSGKDYFINWGSSLDSVRISYSIDGGNTWNIIKDSIPVSNYYGTCNWTAPDFGNAVFTNSTIKIESLDGKYSNQTAPFIFTGLKTPTAEIKRCSEPIEVDGNPQKTAWESVEAHPIDRTFYSESAGFTSLSDLSAYWKACFSDSGIFILTHITADDVHATDGTYGFPWEKDLVEIYFNMNTDKLIDWQNPSQGSSSGMTNNGYYQFSFVAGQASPLPSFAPHTLERVVVNPDNSYSIEAFIKWSDIPDQMGRIYNPSDNLSFGFDVNVSDNDGPANGSPRYRKVWSNIGPFDDWSTMNESGKLTCNTEPDHDTGPFVQDYDGNKYHPVSIGNQVWLRENIRTTHFNNGDSIARLSSLTTYYNTNRNGQYYTFTNNMASFATRLGCLYSWNVLDDTREVCPVGYHVPNNSEWNTLINYLGGEVSAGMKLKDTLSTFASRIGWKQPNNGNNESGFSALPAGSFNTSYLYEHVNEGAYFWTSSEVNYNNAIYEALSSNDDAIPNFTKEYALSVRCIKNDQSFDSIPPMAQNVKVNPDMYNALVVWDTISQPYISTRVYLNDAYVGSSVIFNYYLYNLTPGTTYSVSVENINKKTLKVSPRVSLSFRTGQPPINPDWQYISIISRPNIYDSWYTGDKKQLTGTVARMDSLAISYSLDGVSFIDVDTIRLTSTSFSFDFAVPAFIVGPYRRFFVRVRSLSSPAMDQFSVGLNLPLIEITSPQKGAKVDGGITGTLRGVNRGADTQADVYLSTDGGLNWTFLQSSYLFGGCFDCSVSSIQVNTPATKIALWALKINNEFVAISDTFEIQAPRPIFLSKPNLLGVTNNVGYNPSIVYSGKTYQIYWLTNLIDSVRILYSIDDRNTWQVIKDLYIQGPGENSGSIIWTAPDFGDTAYTNSFIKVETLDGQTSSTTEYSHTFSGLKTLNAEISKTTTPVEIDGDPHKAVWESLEAHPISRSYVFENSGFSGPSDLAAYWKACYNDSGIFVLAHVTADDVHATDGSYGSPWEQDLVEVYFNMNTDTTTFEGPSRGIQSGFNNNGCYQFSILAEPNPSTPSFAPHTLEKVIVNPDNSYSVEMFVKWSEIPDRLGRTHIPNDNLAFGFDLTVSDNDGIANGSPRYRKVWSNFGSDENWYNMKEIGNATCIPEPVIDTLPFVFDVDSNKYHLVTIGNQVWFKENLKTSRFNNGDDIPKWENFDGYYSIPSGEFRVYPKGSSGYMNRLGSLYSWNIIGDSREVCPTGFHVPADVEWNELVDYLGDGSLANAKLKDTLTSYSSRFGWLTPNNGSNESNFSGLPAGYFDPYDPRSKYVNEQAYFWTSSEIDVDNATLKTINGNYNAESISLKGYALSIRCVKNDSGFYADPSVPTNIAVIPSSYNAFLTWDSIQQPYFTTRVYLNDDYIGATSLRRYNFLNLEPGTTYKLALENFNKQTGKVSTRVEVNFTTLPVKKAVIQFTRLQNSIDGNPNKPLWNNIAPNNVDIPYVFEELGFSNASDLSAYWKACYNDSGVFVLTSVKDDIHVTDGTYGYPWEQDIVEVYFDMNADNLKDGLSPSGGVSAGNTNNGHYQFSVLAEPNPGVPSFAPNSQQQLIVNADGSYSVEIFVKWSDIPNINGNVFDPHSNKLIGFDVNVSDNDGPANGAARYRKLWSNNGPNENWFDMDEAGLLQFAPDIIEPVLTAVETSVNEDTPVGTEVTKLYTMENTNVFFSILSGNEDEYFALDSASGVVSIAKLIDFETIPKTAFELKVRATDISNHSYYDTATLVINIIDVVEKSITADFSFITNSDNLKVSFENLSSANATRFLWEFGDGTTTTGSSPTHKYAASGNYYVCLTVWNKKRVNSDKICKEVSVGNACDISSNFVYIINDNKVKFSSTSQGNIKKFHWDFGDGESSAKANPAHKYDQTGNYKVSLKISNKVCSDDTSQLLVIVVNSNKSAELALNSDSLENLKGNYSIKPLDSQLTGQNKLNLQIYPSPFNSRTTISYYLETEGHVELLVYDMTGKRVAVIERANKKSGQYSVTWDGSNLIQGVYSLQLVTAKSKVNKMVLKY